MFILNSGCNLKAFSILNHAVKQMPRKSKDYLQLGKTANRRDDVGRNESIGIWDAICFCMMSISANVKDGAQLFDWQLNNERLKTRQYVWAVWLAD